MKKNTLENFIEKSHKIHGDKYDYSKVEYVNSYTKVCIICQEHGEFWQTPKAHLIGKGCPKCGREKQAQKQTLTTEQFIEKAIKIHGNKYDYSKVNYHKSHDKVHIICPKHGDFLQTPNDHLCGKGCPKCNHQSYKYTSEMFIKKAKELHGDKYSYENVVYRNIKTKILVTCKEHGDFIISPHAHLSSKQGCPKCITKSFLEDEITLFFQTHNTIFEKQKHFDWLGKQSLDFYLPQYNIAIECQGKQHFYPVEYFGGDKSFQAQVECDKRKRILCEEHGINILYYSNLHIEYPYKVYENKEDLLKEILK